MHAYIWHAHIATYKHTEKGMLDNAIHQTTMLYLPTYAHTSIHTCMHTYIHTGMHKCDCLYENHP